MSALCLFAFNFVLTLYRVSSVPIVLKESTPNGQSIIAISSSDPEVEKYLLNSYTSQRVAPEHSLLRSNFYSPEQSYNNARLNSFGVVSSESFHPGTSRNFEESSHINPFFVPFLLPNNLDEFKLNNWFRNIENIYEYPSSAGGQQVRRVTAVNDNGHVYGKVDTVGIDNKNL